MDALTDFLSGTMFWRILLFLHFLMAVALLAAVTLQAATVLIPARQSAGNFIDRFHPVAPATLVPIVVWLYVPTSFWAPGSTRNTAPTCGFRWSSSATGGRSAASSSKSTS